MIRINLLGEREDKSGLYLIQAVSFIAGLVLLIMGSLLYYESEGRHLENLQAEKNMLDQRLVKLEKEVKQVEDFDTKRKVLREKLTTIALLKANKKGPVRILDEINRAIPERAWLLSIKQKSSVLELSGIALDNQTVSDFMRNLEVYPRFQPVELGSSIEYVQDEIKLKQFTIIITLKSALDQTGKAQNEDTTKGKK
jgi:type IV pilus assembly protein PilN